MRTPISQTKQYKRLMAREGMRKLRLKQKPLLYVAHIEKYCEKLRMVIKELGEELR